MSGVGLRTGDDEEHGLRFITHRLWNTHVRKTAMGGWEAAALLQQLPGHPLCASRAANRARWIRGRSRTTVRGYRTFRNRGAMDFLNAHQYPSLPNNVLHATCEDARA